VLALIQRDFQQTKAGTHERREKDTPTGFAFQQTNKNAASCLFLLPLVALVAKRDDGSGQPSKELDK